MWTGKKNYREVTVPNSWTRTAVLGVLDAESWLLLTEEKSTIHKAAYTYVPVFYQQYHVLTNAGVSIAYIFF